MTPFPGASQRSAHTTSFLPNAHRLTPRTKNTNNRAFRALFGTEARTNYSLDGETFLFPRFGIPEGVPIHQRVHGSNQVRQRSTQIHETRSRISATSRLSPLTIPPLLFTPLPAAPG